MLSFKQHKLCFWRFCTGSVVKNFFNIKYSHTGGAGDLKFRLFLRFRYFMASLGASGGLWELPGAPGVDSSCREWFWLHPELLPWRIELLLQLTKQVLKPQQSCCSDDMLKFEHCRASLGVSRELG